MRSLLARLILCLLVFFLLTLLTNSVKPSFTFHTKSVFARSCVSFQLILRSNARKDVPTAIFTSARLSFNEQIPEIIINHRSGDPRIVQKFSSNVTSGDADLSLRPGQVKVLEFSYTPVAQAQIEVRSPAAKLMQGIEFISYSKE